MNDQIINTLKLKLVASELEKLGVTDKSTVVAIAARVDVLDNGALVGLNADGSHGVGNGYCAHLSISDVAREMRANITPPPSRAETAGIKGNPFRAGADFNLTAQMVLMRTDPTLAEDLAAEAGVSLRRNS